MAGSMVRQMIEKGFVKPEDVIASAFHEKRRQQLTAELGIRTTENNVNVAKEADILLLGLKPQDHKRVIRKINTSLRTETLIVTIAVGITMEWIKECFGRPVKLIRAMPNTPAQVGEGVTGFCANQWVTEEEKERIVQMLNTFGQSIEVRESDMEVVGSIGGAAPAFVYIMIEALADGAVAEGMKRDLAYQFASQMVLGSGKLVRDSGLHPGALKDMVCSPGGTTIEGVSLLEERGFRSALMQAVRVCVEKSRILTDQ